MTLVADAGTLASGTGAAGTTIAVTPNLGGATPQLILVHGIGTYSTTDEYMSFGATDGTARVVATIGAAKGEAAADTRHLLRADAVTCVMRGDGTVDGLLDVTAVAADSFTVTVDDAYPVSKTYGWLALAGLDGVSVGTLLLDADQTTGTDSVTGLAFQPDGVILFGYQTTVGTSEAGGEWTLGWSDGTNQRCLVLNSTDAADPTTTSTIFSNTKVWGRVNPATEGMPDHATVAMTADGFTVTRTGGTVDRYVGYVAWKGGQIKMLDTAFNATEVNGTTFTPIAGLFMHGGPLAAFHTTTGVAHAQGGIGWAVSATKRFSAWIADEDALGTTDPHTVQSTAALAINYDKETGATQDGGQDFVLWDADGYTMVADDAGADNYVMASLVFGQAANGSGAAETSTSLRQAILRRRRENGRRK